LIISSQLHILVTGWPVGMETWKALPVPTSPQFRSYDGQMSNEASD